MSKYNHQTAPTQFLQANGIRFAYRRFEKVPPPAIFAAPAVPGNPDQSSDVHAPFGGAAVSMIFRRMSCIPDLFASFHVRGVHGGELHVGAGFDVE